MSANHSSENRISNNIDVISQLILWFTDKLDALGGHEWNLRTVAITTAIVLLGMRSIIGHHRNIDWDAFVHSVITGIGSLSCVYLDIYASEELTGLQEPHRSIGSSCSGPLTSLHRIIPAITQGYAVCDILNGFRLGPAFLAHGVMTLLLTTIFNETDASHILTPMLVLEVSTILLSVLRADFFTPKIQLITQASFALSFFLIRIILSPYLYYGIITTMHRARTDGISEGTESTSTSSWCYPDYLYYTSLLFGGFFNCLNFYCTYHVRKAFVCKIYPFYDHSCQSYYFVESSFACFDEFYFFYRVFEINQKDSQKVEGTRKLGSERKDG